MLLLEAGTGPVFVLYCSPGHLHLGPSWSGAPAENHLKTFFLPVWLVLLNLCAVEGSGNDAGGHGGYQVQVQEGQGGCVQYFLALALAGRARFLAPCWGWLPAVLWLPAATPQQNASSAS